MRVFLTGATGFIGSRIVPQLIGAGHEVVGLTRSDSGAESLRAAGAEPFKGVLEEPEALAKGAEKADAVIHCAFDHDFSTFFENTQKDRRVILAIGEVLKGSDRPFVITSGTGIGAMAPGDLAKEDVFNRDNPNPRVASEIAGAELLDQGVATIAMRLPQVHDTQKQGLVTPLVMMSKAQGKVGYLGEGANRWPAAPVDSVAELYRLAVEQGTAGERFHAVDEEGVSARDIAEALAAGLKLPAVSMSMEEATAAYGHFGMFLGLDMPASSAWTRRRLGWTPKGPGLIEDLRHMDYAAFG